MENIMDFVRPELFILIAFLYSIGLFLKKGTWFHNDWAIPYILLAVSVVVTIAYVCVILGEGFSPETILSSIIQGVLLAAVTVFGNELAWQFITRDEDRRGPGDNN